MSPEVNDYWDPNLYDQKHAFVSEFGDSLVKLLNPTKGEVILDLGCGTGDLTNKLYEIGIHNVIGIDKSINMIEQAKAKYPHLKFLVQDVLDLCYKNEFDAVFSNATLHWVKSPQLALQNMYSSLKSGGRLVAEFGGKGNVQRITNEIINQFNVLGLPYTPDLNPWYFPSIGEYAGLMEEAGFRVTFAQHFDRPTPLDGESGLRNWIQMFASSLLEYVPETQKEDLITNIEKNLKEELLVNGTWMADYKRIRIIGVKE